MYLAAKTLLRDNITGKIIGNKTKKESRIGKTMKFTKSCSYVVI